MIGAVERYAPSARRRRGGAAWAAAARVLVGVLALWLLATHFLLATYRVDSVSMSPALRPADRVAASPLVYGPPIPFSSRRLPGLASPARGDLVVVRPPYAPELPAWQRLAEPLVAFFTLGRATLARDLEGARIDRLMVKRVIGLPGDTVRLQGYAAQVKPQGSLSFVPEEQLLPASFVRRIETAGDAGLPFSGTIAETRLGSDEYFVLGDNRAASSDSRSWGPLKADHIVAKVILRFWPPRSIGRL